MNANDPRHGTPAGASAHKRAGQSPCPSCRDARNEQRRLYYNRLCIRCEKPVVRGEQHCAECFDKYELTLAGGDWVLRGSILVWVRDEVAA